MWKKKEIDNTPTNLPYTSRPPTLRAHPKDKTKSPDVLPYTSKDSNDATPTPRNATLVHTHHNKTRPPGEGYDSEAKDRQVEPVVEEQFLLRMIDDENLLYLRVVAQWEI